MDDNRFVYVTYIATTPQKLWQALTETAFAEQYWCGTRIESSWQVGAPINLWMHNGRLGDSGTILVYDPPRRLSYTWKNEFHEVFSREAPSRVTFELEPVGSLVRLTVIHDQFPPDSKVLPAISQGWPGILCSLKTLLETGAAMSITSVEAAEAVRKKLVDSGGAPPPAPAEASEKPGSLFVVCIGTTAEKLWQALTDGDVTEQYFFGRRMRSDWQVGSPWQMTMPDGRPDCQGIVLESDRPRRLAISWRVVWLEEFARLPEARITFDIEPLDGAVRLVVSEFHHPTIDEKYKEGGRKGWPMILSGLKSLLETGRQLAIPTPQPPAA